jgi:8-oxo-dGTP diphosphatase
MARRSPTPSVRAAGGVVYRLRNGKFEVAVVHRPRYDDWSFPKGKLAEGETELCAAVREVGEELGVTVAVSRRLGDVRYEVPLGLKSVDYWVMRRVDGRFEPTDEVDAAEWLRPKAARELLSYDFDRRVLADFTAIPVPDSVVLLVRHARAGKRNEWRGTDRKRPLDVVGEGQAARLAKVLALFRPDRIVSADLVRCIDTVRPLADHLGVTVRVDPVFGDAEFADSPNATEDALLALAKPGKVTVVCSQGMTIPGLVDRLGRGVHDSDTRKGTFWALSVVDGNVVSTDYYDDAIRS